ncbi:ABC transporter ATP-binding protein [Megasphaera cerevisiae]|uniref:ABC transporter ATP-binding protein n=1 Tax=Megasphaera cerevisiae TaxID=39029 RepID=UPI000944E929|nr:ABC transporter ATP-binding protein [Megasphaera cerevisiae]OKY54838.1 thiamine ABC transporter permease [Megasphaera cerevisiae]
MKRFGMCYAPYYKSLIFVIMASVVTAGLEITFPMIVRHILEVILPARDVVRLGAAAALLLGMYAVCLVLTYFVYSRGRGMGVGIENDLRCRLFRHIESMSFSFFDDVKTGQLLARIISDISEIGDLVFQLPNLIMVCLITMCGSAFFLFYINWKLGALVLFLIAMKTIGTIFLNKRMKKTFIAAREMMGNLSAQAMESLNAIRLIQSFGNEKLEYDKFFAASCRLMKSQRRTFRYEAYLTSSIIFFSNATNLVIIAFGTYFIMKGEMALGDLVAFLMYLMLFIRPIMQLTMLTERYQRGMAGYNRYEELLDISAAVRNGPEKVDLTQVKGHLSFQHVDFSYDGKNNILQDFTLEIQPGETVAIVGATGVGKSSIGSLVPRFYDIQGGKILLDGVDIRTYTLHSLRQAIGIVQQDVFLFSDSIWDNISFGRPGTDREKIIEAARQADADDFIRALPDGYDSFIGERGVKLSGGQKQRISIARVFLKNPPVLILDEATSSLDNETEQKVQEALQHLSQNRTTLIIAHRLATIRYADRIIVLTKEGITETGTHEELMAQKGSYYEVYTSQFKIGMIV